MATAHHHTIYSPWIPEKGGSPEEQSKTENSKDEKVYCGACEERNQLEKKTTKKTNPRQFQTNLLLKRAM